VSLSNEQGRPPAGANVRLDSVEPARQSGDAAMLLCWELRLTGEMKSRQAASRHSGRKNGAAGQARRSVTSGSASLQLNTVRVQGRDARLQRHWRSVQKFHSETALITPYNRAINIQASTWNAQAESRGHERRVIDLDDRRGIREVADLAPHGTAVDQYLRGIDITSPLVRHVSQSPPL
jgi:hypothetical protein